MAVPEFSFFNNLKKHIPVKKFNLRMPIERI